MGIKLDWQIEAERVVKRAGEDPEERSRRRQQRLRLLLFMAGFAASLCAMGALIWVRLYTVDEQLKRELIRVVQAEAATLRLGDYTQFIALQRTAPGGTWFQEQGERFKRYQELKAKTNVNLTGNVIDVAIDSPRGRVVLEEIIDGVPYQAVWFYWRYNDGWHHVPPDYTFWGDPSTINGKVSTISYYSLDSTLAQALAARVERWWADGCGTLGCQNPPKLTIEIIPFEADQARWSSEKQNTLIIPSPLAGGDRARADSPIPEMREDQIAAALSERLFSLSTNNLRPAATSDAGWLRQVVIDWLAATFTGRIDPNAHAFVQSIKEHYGVNGLTAVIRSLKVTSDIGVVGVALKQPIELLAVDWRSFFQWRLDVEKTLLSRNDTVNFQALWDSANPNALAQMRQRMTNPTQPTPQVQAVTISPGADGVARATVQTKMNNQALTIIFRLVDGSWKRSG